MPRPRKCRKVGFFPENTVFIPKKEFTSEIVLTFEELESLRLCDFEEMDQLSAADSMDVSRGTLQRILNTARKKMVDAIINGKLIKIADCECGKNDCTCHNQKTKCNENTECHLNENAIDQKGEQTMNKNNENCKHKHQGEGSAAEGSCGKHKHQGEGAKVEGSCGKHKHQGEGAKAEGSCCGHKHESKSSCSCHDTDKDAPQA